MIRTFDKRYRGDHPMFDPNVQCDECHEVIPEKEDTYEYGKNYICRSCRDKHVDEGEQYFLGPE